MYPKGHKYETTTSIVTCDDLAIGLGNDMATIAFEC